MVSPDFYWQIIQMLDDRKMEECTISFTTNLWDWWLHPKKWDKLFRHPRVRIATSFHYGDSRQIRPGEVYTEEKFLKVMNKFIADFGYPPTFISVITNENKHLSIHNVRLAKFLGTECKLNYAVASGREGKPFPIGEMYNIYMDVYEEGLAQWEFSTMQMIEKLKGNEFTTCPLNRSCDSGIRNLQPTSETGYDYGSCGDFGDDQEYGIDFEKEMAGEFFTPLSTAVELSFMKEECLTCPMFSICNGCYKTVKDLKQADMVEYSCSQMKKARERAIKAGLTE